MSTRRKKVGESGAAYGAAARTKSARRGRLSDWEWIQANRSALEDEYAGRWIAVAGNRVVGSGVRLATAMRRARSEGADQPFVMAFPPRRRGDVVEVAHWL